MAEKLKFQNLQGQRGAVGLRADSYVKIWVLFFVFTGFQMQWSKVKNQGQFAHSCVNMNMLEIYIWQITQLHKNINTFDYPLI